MTLLVPADTRVRPQLWLQAAKKCFPSSTFIMAKKTAIGIDLGGWVQTVSDKDVVAQPKVCKVLWRCRFSGDAGSFQQVTDVLGVSCRFVELMCPRHDLLLRGSVEE